MGAVQLNGPLNVTQAPEPTTATAQPMLAVYGHVVTWRHLVITAVLLLLSMTALAARVVLREQQALVRLPQELSVQASLTRKVVVNVDQVLPVRVPIQQDISIPLQDPIPVQVSIDTVVPVNLTVPVKHVFKLDQVIDVDSTVRTRVS